MKKFNVECVDVTPEMIAGVEPWSNVSMGFGFYVEAETEAEAIENIMQWLVEGSTNATIENNMVIYRGFDDDIMGGNAFFTATEIK